MPIVSYAQEFSVITNFGGANGNGPAAGLVQGPDGNFYGTTINGGIGDGSDMCLPPYGGCGTVFTATPDGTVTTLYSFCSQANCSDGSYPSATLVRGPDGNYYGTTVQGGINSYGTSYGTVFRITPTGTFAQLYSFCAQRYCPDGFWPVNGLVLASDGNFYGTTDGGGAYDGGTVFKITPSGSLTTIYSFCATRGCPDGSAPQAALLQAADGNLYGTTWGGGTANDGTVFRITLGGALTTLYSFNGQDGMGPQAALIQATDGNFYGTTEEGGVQNNNCGSNGCGTVFKITPTGALTTIYTFSGPDGGLAVAGLLQAKDGDLYGTTWNGGAYSVGTVFKLTTSGRLTTLHNFTGFDGEAQLGVLLQATDGNLYGTSGAGGLSNAGTIFKLTYPLQFVPVTGCRLVDTRQTGGPIQGGTVRSFNIPQLGGCAVPTAAAAYSLNVTVVPQGPLGYLTIWPEGDTRPRVSTMNSPDGRVKANAAIVGAGNNAVNVYATDTTNVILDVDGYFAPPNSQTLQFYPLTPCRVIDTRGANGDFGGPYLRGRVERDFPVSESACLPSGVAFAAYSMNVTVVPHHAGQRLGYLTLWPEGEPQPTVSTLNNPTATVVANAAIVTAGNGGEIASYPSDDTDLIVDVNGYFAAPGQGGSSFYPVVPCRAYDSRNNNGQPFTGTIILTMMYTPCPPPSDATSYAFDATVVPSGPLPYLTLWPDSEQEPVVSTLNAYDGLITSNMAIVLNVDGAVDADAAQGHTQMILDIWGYFAP